MQSMDSPTRPYILGLGPRCWHSVHTDRCGFLCLSQSVPCAQGVVASRWVGRGVWWWSSWKPSDWRQYLHGIVTGRPQYFWAYDSSGRNTVGKAAPVDSHSLPTRSPFAIPAPSPAGETSSGQFHMQGTHKPIPREHNLPGTGRGYIGTVSGWEDLRLTGLQGPGGGQRGGHW